MRCYLSAIIGVLLVSILITPRVCAQTETQVGIIPPEEGVWEDWCVFDEERWNLWVPARKAEAKALCTNFGGKFILIPDEDFEWGGPDGPPQTGIATYPNAPINLEGRSLVVRAAMTTDDPDAFGFLAYFRNLLWDDPWGRFEWTADRLDLFILDGPPGTTDEYIRLEPYEPHGAHAWWKIRHDAATNMLHLETAPFCGGPWTTHLSGEMVTRGHRNLVLEIFMNVGEDKEGPQNSDPVWYGPIYILEETDVEDHIEKVCRSTETGEEPPVDPFGEVCVQTNTFIGNPPADAENGGLWEDWCGSLPGGPWEVLLTTNGVPSGYVSPICANFGGKVEIGVSDPNSFGWGAVRMEPGEGFDFRNHFSANRFSPMRGGSPWSMWAIFQEGGDGHVEVTLNLEEGETPILEFWSSDGEGFIEADELSPYQPDEAHAWIAIAFDADEEEVHLYTAPYCGTWTHRFTRRMEAPLNDVLMEFHHERVPGGGTYQPGSVGQVYVLPYPEGGL